MRVTTFLVASCALTQAFLAPCVVPSRHSSKLLSTEEKKQVVDLEKFMESSAQDLDSYHKGGNARYTKPVVTPAALTSSDEEECEEVMIDFATGDELCWGQAPTHARNNLVDATKGVGSARHVDVEVADDYHKGGNAHYKAKQAPRKLKDLDEDEEYETPFMDFVSGDELCWNKYS